MMAALFAGFAGNAALAQSKLKKAPQWVISEWLNSDGLSLSELRGKVVIVDESSLEPIVIVEPTIGQFIAALDGLEVQTLDGAVTLETATEVTADDGSVVTVSSVEVRFLKPTLLTRFLRLGTRPDAYETNALQAYVKDFPAAAVARDQLQYATAELSVHENGRVYKIINDNIQAALTGAKSPEKALKDAQKQASRIVKRYQ